MGREKTPQKVEMLPGTLEMLILKALERNAGPVRGYGVALYLRSGGKWPTSSACWKRLCS